MRIIQWDESNSVAVQGCYVAQRAALAVDDPDGSPMSAHRVREMMSNARGTDRGESWFATGTEAGDADVVGWYRLKLPDRENRDHGFLRLVVHPAHRRRGIGTELLRHAARRTASDGRPSLGGETFKGTAGDAFAAHVGAKAGVTEAKRILDIGAIPPGKIAALRKSATAAAVGYSLVTWIGRTPDEHLDGVASVMNAMNDAPSDYEDERWDAQRVREEIDGRLESSGNRRYTVGAVHDATGQLAAATTLVIDPEFPDWGLQGGTMVTRPHRGHRLGTLVKTAMLEWLATVEPALRRVETGNAAVNKYMIAINEELGFKVVHPWWQAYEISVKAVLDG